MSTALITRFAAIEQKLDTVLFRNPDDDEQKRLGFLKSAAVTVPAIYAGTTVKHALAPMVADRKAGLRATVAGFTGKSNLAQNIAATGSALKDKPLQAAGAIGNTVVTDAKNAAAALKNSAAGKGFLRARAGGAGILGSLRRGLGGAAAALTRGRVKFSATTRLVELAAKLN